MDRVKLNKKIILVFRLGFMVASIYIILSIVDIDLVFIYLKEIPILILAIVIVINILRSWLHGIRWQLLNPDITGQLNRWQYFRFIMISHTFNLILPGALGGDFAKTALTLQTVKNKRIDNVMAIIADRFVGLLSILFLGTIAFTITSEIPNRTNFLFFFVLTYLTVFVLYFLLNNSCLQSLLVNNLFRLGRIGVWLSRVIEIWKSTLRYYADNKRKVALSFLICLPIHLVSFATAYILARTLNIQISFFDITLIISLMWIITAIPITISGAGVRELSLIYLFSIYGVEAEFAIALSVYIYIIFLIQGLLGLLFMVDWRKIALLKPLQKTNQ